MANRPVLLISLILLILAGVFYFIGPLGSLVMPLLLVGAICLVIAVVTGR